MATNVRRTTTSRKTKAASSSSKAINVDPDQLAKDLSRKLTLNDTDAPRGQTSSSKTSVALRMKGKQKATVAASDTLRVVEDKSPAQVKVESMRAVNCASQALSEIVQSGWKRSSASPVISADKETIDLVQKSALEAAQHLGSLRAIAGATTASDLGDLDVERAAGSVLSKLVTLEMFDVARPALEEMHPYICKLIGVLPQSSDSGQLHLLSVPQPPSCSASPVLLNLLSTYLLCALSVACRAEKPSNSSDPGHQRIDDLASYLTLSSTHSLLSWIPRFQLDDALPQKHVDSLLTRAYPILTKHCSSTSSPAPTTVASKIPPSRSRTKSTVLPLASSGNLKSTSPLPTSLFSLRIYALRCLCHTSTGIVEPKTFWDQAVRFTSAYVKSSCGTSPPPASNLMEGMALAEETMTKDILGAFHSLHALSYQRQEADAFFSLEDGFGTFCEYWAGFAKRAGDIALLQRIHSIQDPSSRSSSTPLSSSKNSTITLPTSTPTSINYEDSSSPSQDPPTSQDTLSRTLIVQGTKVANVLTQLTVVLEKTVKDKELPSDEQEIDQLLSLAQESSGLLQILASSGQAAIRLIIRQPVQQGEEKKEDAQLDRVSAKVDRAFERVRRLALKAVEVGAGSSFSHPSKVEEVLKALLLRSVECFEAVLLSSAATLENTSAHSTILDILTRTLDILFILARTGTIVNNPTTFVPVFELLARGRKAVEVVSNLPRSSTADWNGLELGLANLTRCLSGAFYNLAGQLYQGMRYGNAVAFLKEGCVLGEKALLAHSTCLKRQQAEGENSADIKGTGKEEEWKQLEEQLFRRWELLGVCYSKAGDRRKAYDAYKRAILAFPFDSSGLTQRTETLAPDALFNPSSAEEATCSPQLIKQLVGLVDRVTYIGTCELFLGPHEVSICSSVTIPIPRSPRRHRKQSSATSTSYMHHRTSSSVGSFERPKMDLSPSIVGTLLERQLDSLESSRWKEGVKGIYIRLLQDALDAYSVKGDDGTYRTPVRRARVLVRCLEYMYRDGGGDGEFGFGGPGGSELMQMEVENLCTSQILHADAKLSKYTHQYRISANLWLSLHAHKRGDEAQNTVMTMRSEEACRLIQDLLSTSTVKNIRSPYATKLVGSPKAVRKVVSSARPSVEGSTPKVARIVSPPRTRMTRTTKAPAAPKKSVPVKKNATRGKPAGKARVEHNAAVNVPVTPNAKQGTEETKRTPPRRSLDGPLLPLKSPFVFDNFEGLLSLLQLVARLLGILSLILAKAHLLDMTRKLAQRHAGPASDGYILASMDLAHEYVTLGKLKRAAAIFKPALEVVHSGQASEEASVRLLLRFAEHLAAFEDIPKSAKAYLQAFDLWKQLDLEQKGLPTQQRILARVKVLEITAIAAHVFAAIQFVNADVCASLDALLQSLRLWNRAIDTITRLRPPATGSSSDRDPFELTSLKDALPSSSPTEPEGASTAQPTSPRRPAMEGIEWCISEGLLSTLFALVELYSLRGSAREAEYFAKQAADMAEQLNAPAMLSRAFLRQVETQLHMGKPAEAKEGLQQAASLVQDMPGLDQADVRRLKVDWHLKKNSGSDDEDESNEEDPKDMFEETVTMLNELDQAFLHFDGLAFGPRRSLGVSPGVAPQLDVLAPRLLSTVLCQQLWLLRDDVGDAFNNVLEKLISLSSTKRAKAEEDVLMAKLVMHSVHGRFRGDMFLSSLTESTISIPIGLISKDGTQSAMPSRDILDSLSKAEKLLWDYLTTAAHAGSVLKVRESLTSLVVIGAFRTSLGDCRMDLPLIMATLLDTSSALTLRRDMLDAINRKISVPTGEDLRWSSLSESGLPLSPTTPTLNHNGPIISLSDSEDDGADEHEPHCPEADMLRTYWSSIRSQYSAHISELATKDNASELPHNWTVINIGLTPDHNSLFICRREGGSNPPTPLLFCIPLKGRRDHGGEDDENYLSFSGAMGELRDIVQSSDKCTKAASKIKTDDQEARSNWWNQRRQLDTRMRQLLENIEYCWLGAFKTILSCRPDISLEAIHELRTQLEKVFHASLRIKDRKIKKTPRKKNISQPQAFAPSQFQLDDNLLRCLSTLSPKCRDEELEDLVYFVLDLYQFHGVPVAIAEVDIDQMVVDLRTVFEEHGAKTARERKNLPLPSTSDEHIFLVLDKNVQGLPWESIPILRGRSVSRVPGVQFLYDRIAFAKCRQNAAEEIQTYDPSSRPGAFIDARQGYFILNPSGDLSGTEDRFRGWANGMQDAGWDGTIGKPVSEQQFINALRTRDLVVYFGHGGGEQYVRSHQIRNLPKCAATMLWGCSSGALKEMGDFDRTGTPYNYMLAGCPTLVANLWDVTDKDIDKISLAVFDRLSLNGDSISSPKNRQGSPTSLVTAVAQSRDCCKLKYLTGAAPVVYGIPFYL